MNSAKDIKELRQRTGVGILDCKKALEATNSIEEAIEWLRHKGIAKGTAKAGREATEGVIVIHQENNLYTLIEVNCETDFVARNKTFQETAKKLAKMMQADLLLEPSPKIQDILNQETFRIGEKIAISKVKHVQVDPEKVSVGMYVHNGYQKGGIVLIEKPVTDEISEQVAMHMVAMNPLFAKREEISEEFKNKEKLRITEQLVSSNKPKAIIEKIIQGKLNKLYSEIVLEEQQYALSEKKKERIIDLTKGARVIEMHRFEVGVKSK